MSGNSWKHYYEPLSASSLTYDQPVDTFTVRTAMDNVAHLVDSSPVYRINWVDPTGVRTLPYAFLGGTHWQYMTFAHEFPTTVLRDGRYLGFDVRVAANITSDVSGILNVTIATPDVAYPINDPTAPGILGHATTFMSNSTPDWVIETQFTGEGLSITPQYQPMVCRNTGEYAPDALSSTQVGKLRCIVAALGIWPNEDYDTEMMRVFGIQVREYINE